MRTDSSRRRLRKGVLSLAVAAVLAPAALLAPAANAAPSPQERKNEVDAAAERARDDLAHSTGAARAAADALAAVERDLAAARAESARAASELAAAQDRDSRSAADLSAAEEALAEAERQERAAAERVEAQRLQVGERASAAYRSGGQMGQLQVVLQSDDAEQLMSRMDYLGSVMSADGKVLDELGEAQAQQAAHAAERARAREEVAVMRAVAADALAASGASENAARAAEVRVDELVSAQAGALATAEARRAEDENLAGQLEAESEELGAELAELARQAEAQAAREEAARQAEAARAAAAAPAPRRGSSGGGGAAPAPRAPAPVAAPSGSGMVRPAAGRLSSGFGPRMHPIYRTSRMHNGIDIAAPTGTPVVAALSGRVVSAGYSGSAGNMVVVDHGVHGGSHLTTVYMHLSVISVRPGQSLGRGERLGSVGSTGASTGPHLHFETRLSGRPVNPMNYL